MVFWRGYSGCEVIVELCSWLRVATGVSVQIYTVSVRNASEPDVLESDLSKYFD
jgi:hypothetical protein